MRESQKGSQPESDENDAAVVSQDPLHLGESLLEIVGQRVQMVRASLDDEDIFTASGERKFAAIADNAFRWPAILGDQTGRQVHAFDAVKPRRSRAIKPFPRPQKSSTISALRGH